MKQPDDNDTVDAELKSYLDGQDGVSAAWRKANAEQPPAALDALILSAARTAVHQPLPGRGGNRLRSYRLVASFMAGVLVTSLYFNRLGDGVELTDQAGVSAPSGPQASDFAEPQAVPAEALQVDRETLAENVAVAVRQIAAEAIPAPVIPAPRIPAASPISQAVPDAPEANGARARALASSTVLAPADAPRPADQTPATVSPVVAVAQVGLGAAPLDQAAGLATDIAAAKAELQQAGITQLEEIVVTGSRIAEAARAPGYRASQQEWLAHILGLSQQVNSLVDELGAETSSLEEEMNLFSRTYPDVDLEAAFENLSDQQ